MSPTKKENEMNAVGIECNLDTRGGRMLDGLVRHGNRNGKVVVTVDLHRPDRTTGLHQPLRFKAYTRRNGERVLSVDLMDGDWAAGTYATKVLEWDVATGRERTPYGGSPSDALLVYAARAAYQYLTTGEAPTPSNGTVAVEEREHCGCCGRELDRPESIELGIGPECARRIGVAHSYRSSRLVRSRSAA